MTEVPASPGNRILLTELLLFFLNIMKILTVVGARPQFIKAAAVSRVLRAAPGVQEILLHTGQHYDANMSSVFFEELGIPAPEYNLGVGSGSHAVQTAQMLAGIEEVLIKEHPDRVMVYGDTNSTLAGALSAVKLNIPVAHVEAGLRSFNHAMPEEINRIVTDRISNLLFAPTLTAVSHLEQEGLGGFTRFTGDVMYDSLLYYREMVKRDESKYALKGIKPGFLLATIHRVENTDQAENLVRILDAFAAIGSRIILPIHPRTRKTIADKFAIPSNVSVIDPVGYLEMLWLTMNSVKVLTDSGGLQKEAYLLGKPCVTIRTETEWTETLHDGWNIVTGNDPAKILNAANAPGPSAPRKDAFGNGKASEIITGLLTS
jgi:UDP-GlcNAc3NAcA epimerase